LDKADSRKEGDKVSTLSYDKTKLIASIKAKRAEYLKNFEEQKEYKRKELLAEIQHEIDKHQADIVLINSGQAPTNYYRGYRFDKPQTEKYDQAIARLENCTDDVIKLSDKSDDRILGLLS
jgi:thiamine pyrophosphate-dependent acetolactate synthase large subunit-like protein